VRDSVAVKTWDIDVSRLYVFQDIYDPVSEAMSLISSDDGINGKWSVGVDVEERESFGDIYNIINITVWRPKTEEDRKEDEEKDKGRKEKLREHRRELYLELKQEFENE